MDHTYQYYMIQLSENERDDDVSTDEVSVQSHNNSRLHDLLNNFFFLENSLLFFLLNANDVEFKVRLT